MLHQSLDLCMRADPRLSEDIKYRHPREAATATSKETHEPAVSHTHHITRHLYPHTLWTHRAITALNSRINARFETQTTLKTCPTTKKTTQVESWHVCSAITAQFPSQLMSFTIDCQRWIFLFTQLGPHNDWSRVLVAKSACLTSGPHRIWHELHPCTALLRL